MRVICSRTFVILVLAVATSPLLFADYTYEETTQITGGSILHMMKFMGHFSSEARKSGDPVVSTVYLKDNRMAKVNANDIEIIDLDKETITNIDLVKKTYTVMTFDQMKQAIENARQEMQKKQAEQPAAAQPADPNPDVKLSFDVKVRNTGADKAISGLLSKEAILTMTMNATDQKTQQSGSMAITNDMWMVPEIPGYDQVRDFEKRFAEKMATATAGLRMDMSQMLAQNPGANEALADMGKEMRKLDGVPVMQITRMGMTTNGQPLPAASEAPLPQDQGPQMPSAGDVAKQSAASMITSRFGFGGFGKKKKDDQSQQAPAQNANQGGNTPPPTNAILMESQTTVSNFSSGPVDASHFDVPAGFKQVQPQMEKHQ